MALWNGLGQAATIAQLAGIDAGGLVSMIIQAVQTVHRNKEECRHLVHHVMMIGDLLQMLQESEMMRRPEIRRPLDGLEDTLRQAYMLVTSCQQSNIMYRFLMAGNQAQKFRDIRDRIDSYLRIYPIISHLDTRSFITEIHSRILPSSTQPQTAEEMLESSNSLSNLDSRTEGRASDDNGIESVEAQPANEPFSVEQQQQDGYGSTMVLPNRRHWFRRLVLWSQREQPTASYINEATGHFKVFKLSELAAATDNFSSHRVLGRGAFGSVYKGTLANGVDVAIKTLSSDSRQGQGEFLNEVRILTKLQHRNIVKLLGLCSERDYRMLVYEYMPRGDLHHVIHEMRAGVYLAWSIRFQIIEGIALGAVYLHQHSRLFVIHRDLKTSNILLDCDMTPTITDFGLAKVLHSDEGEEMTGIVGTVGYLAPEYAMRGIVSVKTDVYAFGVIFLMIITGQGQPWTTSDLNQSLVCHAWELWSSGRAMDLIDPSLHDEPQISDILRCIQIALLCVQTDREDRPMMSDVLMMLRCDSMVLPVPLSPLDAWTQDADLMTEEESSSSDADNDDATIVA